MSSPLDKFFGSGKPRQPIQPGTVPDWAERIPRRPSATAENILRGRPASPAADFTVDSKGNATPRDEK